ncbi:hypothetical protein CEXT_571291 [Caerostris extrusa]|uniref:Uncharacterized protein n=1 Tax=Caerostris extrusa TaxID=172846 RepID=A0AAV4N8H9_CAEEX|nr:hypothetical protein CEXT_571291 [Caerostris extrusa]
MASLVQLKDNIPASKFIADFLSQDVNLKGDLVWKTFSYSQDNLNFYDFDLRNKFVAFKSKEEWSNSFNFHALHEHESSVSESTLSAKSLDCINHLSHFNVYVLEFRGFEPTGFTTLSIGYSLECKNFCLLYQKVGHRIASLLVEASIERKWNLFRYNG